MDKKGFPLDSGILGSTLVDQFLTEEQVRLAPEVWAMKEVNARSMETRDEGPSCRQTTLSRRCTSIPREYGTIPTV